MKRRYLGLSLLLVLMITVSCLVKKVEQEDRSDAPVTIVILGSSTAAGTGPEDISNSWVNRYLIYTESVNPGHHVINLAKGGYTTYHMMPRDSLFPDDRPKPDPCRCITMALSLDPAAIIINLPSNDASYGYTVEEQLVNYDEILSAAGAEGVPVWVTTTQPRNLSPEGRRNLVAVRDSTIIRLGDRAIDFWAGLARSDGTIDLAYDSGDGVHLNDAGHQLLFDRVVEAGILETVSTKSKINVSLL